MKIPQWLSKEEEDAFTMTIPTIARLPEPVPSKPLEPTTPERELITRALAVANEQEQQQKELVIKLTETTLRLESANRRVHEQMSTIATLQNNELNYQAQIEQLRQEAANLRAFFQQHRATLDYLLKRFDDYGMPKTVKNNVTQGKVLPGPATNSVEEVKAEAKGTPNGTQA
jgi:chromosome segregation ATPase